MGKTSGKLSDFTIITSDNPRLEKPETIINQIEKGIKKTKGKFLTFNSQVIILVFNKLISLLIILYPLF